MRGKYKGAAAWFLKEKKLLFWKLFCFLKKTRLSLSLLFSPKCQVRGLYFISPGKEGLFDDGIKIFRIDKYKKKEKPISGVENK